MGTPLAGKRFLKKFMVCDEMLISLNMFMNELLTGPSSDLATSRKDFDIINSFLQYPIVAQRLFNSPEEANRMIGMYLDRNNQLLRMEGFKKLETTETQESFLRQLE